MDFSVAFFGSIFPGNLGLKFVTETSPHSSHRSSHRSKETCGGQFREQSQVISGPEKSCPASLAAVGLGCSHSASRMLSRSLKA